jgi:hypothetical protein
MLFQHIILNRISMFSNKLFYIPLFLVTVDEHFNHRMLKSL